MEDHNTNSRDVGEKGIGRYFAGKTVPQIIFGSAVWACFLGYFLFTVGQIVMYLILSRIGTAGGFSSDVWKTAIVYLAFFGVWIMFFLNALLRKNRPLLKAYGPGLSGNRIPELAVGLLTGFGMNGLLILFAMMHGDIHLYFDRFNIGAFLILFAAVFIQSAAEEIMCRGFIYHRVLRTYRGQYLAAALVNGIFFGLIHITNEGATPVAIIDIIICGIQYSAMVYYFDSVWMTMGAHAGWNFTQSILAGLPNSGTVFPYSIFRLDAATAASSFFYDVGFGVEGTIPAVILEILVLVLIIVIGRKMKRKHTDIWESPL
ncbi:MAG: type II CAAX endopeptidase family protein [Eubacteriales bacterium]|nr:type II CAAX endopeptidase family protein [Eubacteriales bacterium]